MRKLTICTATVLFLTATSVFALDKADEDALKDTQNLLGNQEAMQALTKDNKDAARALDQVNELTNGNKQEQVEVNNLSSSIFSDMVKQNDGDAVAIQAKLQQALKDPNGFMQSLTPEQRAKLHGLAAEIDRQNGGAAKQSGNGQPMDPRQDQLKSMIHDLGKDAGTRGPASP